MQELFLLKEKGRREEGNGEKEEGRERGREGETIVPEIPGTMKSTQDSQIQILK